MSMEITRLIDNYGDDIFALALMITKDFNSAKQVFLKTCLECKNLPDNSKMPELAAKVFSECKEAESNDNAVTLTGVELSDKQRRLLEVILQKPQMTRAIIHMCYENDMQPEQISKITGAGVKYIKGVLDGLSNELEKALSDCYKEICMKIHAGDELKAYTVRAINTGDSRTFEVKRDAAPIHSWTKKQKTIVIIAAAIATLLICIIIPILDSYYHMRKEEGFSHYENVPTDEIFSQTVDSPE